jgi:hypothetical protein
MVRFIVLWFSDTPVTATGITVTTHVAVLLPSAVATVIVAVPAATPVTSPVLLTVATLVLVLDHARFWFVALLGRTVATSISLPPTDSVVDVLLSDTEVGGTELTVTAHVAVLLPSAVATVIVAVPAATPVTSPPLTVATLVLLVYHVTALFVALLGRTVAVSVSLPPTDSVVDVLFSDTDVGEILAALTVTTHVAV